MGYYATWREYRKYNRQDKEWFKKVYKSVIKFLQKNNIEIESVEYFEDNILNFETNTIDSKQPLQEIPEKKGGIFWTKMTVGSKTYRGVLYFDPYDLIPQIPEFTWEIHTEEEFNTLIKANKSLRLLLTDLFKSLDPKPDFCVLGEHSGAIELEYGVIDVEIERITSFSKPFAKVIKKKFNKKTRTELGHLKIEKVIEQFIYEQFNGKKGIQKLVDKANMHKKLVAITPGSIVLRVLNKEDNEWEKFLEISAELLEKSIYKLIKPRETFVKELGQTLEKID